MSASGLMCRSLTFARPATGAVLDRIDTLFACGRATLVTGPTGSGKSTLLHLLGGLDVPTAGTVSVEGVDFATLSEAARGRVRNRALGFIYQFHHLLPEFSAVENAAMPLIIRRLPPREAHAWDASRHSGSAPGACW